MAAKRTAKRTTPRKRKRHATNAAPKRPKPKRENLTEAIVTKTLISNHGNLTATGKALAKDRSTISRFLDAHPGLWEHVQAAREELADRAEDQLRALVEAGEWDAVKFTLKTLGKTRGYVEKQQTEHTGSVRLNLGALSDAQLEALEGIVAAQPDGSEGGEATSTTTVRIPVPQ